MSGIIDHSEDGQKLKFRLLSEEGTESWVDVEAVYNSDHFTQYLRGLSETTRLHLQTTLNNQSLLKHKESENEYPGIDPLNDSLDSFFIEPSSPAVDHTEPLVSISPVLEDPSTHSSPGFVKRGRGRPRKYPFPSDSGDSLATPVIKRGRGRPRKHPVTPPVASDSPVVKRGRGRPRKTPLVSLENGSPSSDVVKRPRGRPRKNSATPIVISSPSICDDIPTPFTPIEPIEPKEHVEDAQQVLSELLSCYQTTDSSDESSDSSDESSCDDSIGLVELPLKRGIIESLIHPMDMNEIPSMSDTNDILMGDDNNNNDVDDVSPVKKKRGRPRKYPAVESHVSSDTPKRGRGRPPKPKTPEGQITPKRGRGRPRKISTSSPVTPTSSGGAKRGRGRPRKYPLPSNLDSPSSNSPNSDGIIKRGRGRPRKKSFPVSPSPDGVSSIPRNGSVSIGTIDSDPPKRGRGRPKKVPAVPIPLTTDSVTLNSVASKSECPPTSVMATPL